MAQHGPARAGQLQHEGRGPQGAKNRAAKVAAMPVAAAQAAMPSSARPARSSARHMDFKRKGRATRSPREAPMCKAPASLPTEAPPAMERAVPRRMPGARAGEMGSSARMASTTDRVVVSRGSFRARYRRRLATASRGSRNKSQGKRADRSAAKPTVTHSTAEAAAPTIPMATAKAPCRAARRPSIAPTVPPPFAQIRRLSRRFSLL